MTVFAHIYGVGMLPCARFLQGHGQHSTALFSVARKLVSSPSGQDKNETKNARCERGEAPKHLSQQTPTKNGEARTVAEHPNAEVNWGTFGFTTVHSPVYTYCSKKRMHNVSVRGPHIQGVATLHT